MLTILQSEWLKLRKSNMTGILFVGPLIGLCIGLGADLPAGEGMNEWQMTVLVMNLGYALLFLPLITAVLAGLVCRYEHQAGGWKQLLALPVTRGSVFLAKYVLLLALALFMQLLYLAVIYTVGTMKGFTSPFPSEVIWKSILGGWVAVFPLIALQLWMSILFKSFAAPFAVNVMFTLPAILAINSERFGPFYPWAQPFSMMYIGEGTNDVFFIPWEQLLTVVGGSFLLFFIGGYVHFQRKAV
ncbi:ABC transporter permease [Ectobacillus ponti]|uniref:ABC transporter permease n=1 Tax=Ectobacillus ponti TaxID=2961894 RepID=A0AA41X6N7_9BACI|nr:ABC transporter permease [Ectobacillus ponti]MCP8967609.1 ABC transporter permease [Ectobacillus ponti]